MGHRRHAPAREPGAPSRGRHTRVVGGCPSATTRSFRLQRAAVSQPPAQVRLRPRLREGSGHSTPAAAYRRAGVPPAAACGRCRRQRHRGHPHAGIQEPVGTHTGWSLRKEGVGTGDFFSLSGSFVPFARTKAEREAKGDPRPSIEERYASHDEYVQRIQAAADALVSERLLLQEDATGTLRRHASGTRWTRTFLWRRWCSRARADRLPSAGFGCMEPVTRVSVLSACPAATGPPH